MVVRTAGEDILFKPIDASEEGNTCFDNEIVALLDRKQYIHTEQLFGIIYSAHKIHNHVKSWNFNNWMRLEKSCPEQPLQHHQQKMEEVN